MSGTYSVNPLRNLIAQAIGIPSPSQQEGMPTSLLGQLLLAEQQATAGVADPNRKAIDTLTGIAGSQESGTPAGPPAAPGSALDAPRGLGTLGGIVGGLATAPLGAAPIGRATGNIIGSAIGNAMAASRAQEIAAEFGLDPTTGPGRAAAIGAMRAAPTQIGSALGVPMSGLLGQIAGSFTPSYDARAELADRFNTMAAITAMDPYMQMIEMRRLYAAMDEAPSAVDFGMDPSWGGPNPGEATGNAGQQTGSDFGSPSSGGSETGPSGVGMKAGGPVKYAEGGSVIELQGGGKIAIGPGGGLDDLIPTSINGRRAAALSDGEFVIPADVVSMLGDGSSNAGSRRLYDIVRQIRQAKTGTSEQAGPLPVGEILKRAMS